jgi:hypothetical protein
MIKLLMLNLQQRVEQVKLLHHAERSAMNGVAAEVAVEVFMLFEHDDIDALACEEQSENDAGGSSAYNTDCSVKSFIHKQLSSGDADSGSPDRIVRDRPNFTRFEIQLPFSSGAPFVPSEHRKENYAE